MSLDLLIGIAGVAVTVLVVVGMILITPGGATTRPRSAETPGTDEDAGADAGRDGAAPPAARRTTRPSLPTLP